MITIGLCICVALATIGAGILTLALAGRLP